MKGKKTKMMGSQRKEGRNHGRKEVGKDARRVCAGAPANLVVVFQCTKQRAVILKPRERENQSQPQRMEGWKSSFSLPTSPLNSSSQRNEAVNPQRGLHLFLSTFSLSIPPSSLSLSLHFTVSASSSSCSRHPCFPLFPIIHISLLLLHTSSLCP